MRTAAVWACEYRQDRKRRHRCRCCGILMEPGDRVLMARTRHSSIAIHEACAPLPHKNGRTWADAMKEWAR